MPTPTTRRRFLGSAVATSVALLAGCSGSGEESPRDTGTTAGSGAGSPATTERTASATPAAEGPAPSDESTRTRTQTRTQSPTATETWTPSSDQPASFEGYEETTVRVETPSGEFLGAVRAAISDTTDLRYTGLSDTASLPEDWGMLFVYDSVGDHTYVMREMDFGLDIVFAGADGEITTIHHAPEPGPDEDGNEQTYPGTGQNVLEVNYEWTDERGVEEGDYLQFEL